MRSIYGRRAWGISLSLWASAWLAACGGGGGGMAAPPPPTATALPDSVTITAPGTVESATAVQFGNSAAPLTGYSYLWDFGDGSQSSEAAPSHRYAKGGDFDILLTLSNEAGQKREARATVSVTNLANVQGLVCSAAQSAGWCIQSPRPAGTFSDAFLVDAGLGWAVTAKGEIFKTTDGGASWETQTAPVKGDLRTVRFFDADTGWILGKSALALRTSDAGRHWLNVRLDATAPNPEGDFQIVSASTAYFWPAQYPQTYAYVTSSGGASWRQLMPAPTHIASGEVYWLLHDRSLQRSANAGMTLATVLDFDTSGIVANSGDAPRLVAHPEGKAAALFTQERINDPASAQAAQVRTTVTTTADGGLTWQSQPAGCIDAASVDCFNLNPISISADGQTLLATGNGVFRSTDSGKTWSLIPEIPQRAWFVALRAGDNIGLAVDANPSPVYLSRDGGKSFSSFYAPAGIGTQFGKLQAQPATGQLTYTHNGNLWLSRDDGTTWERLFYSMGSPENGYFNEVPNVAMLDARHGFILDSFGEVRETTDGGKTMSRVGAGVLAGASKIQFINDKLGWFAKYDAVNQISSIYRTSDGGQNWALVNSRSGYAVDFRFETETMGWIRTPYPYRDPPKEDERGYTFQITKDGGQTWQDIQAPSGSHELRLAAVPGRWIVTGERGLIASTASGGAPWITATSGVAETLTTLVAPEGGALWALGTTSLLTSKDAGVSWTALPFACAPKDIAFAGSKAGWVVCGRSIMATTDGGATWHTQAIPAIEGSLSKIVVSDAKTAWVAGPKNTLLATGSGGQ